MRSAPSCLPLETATADFENGLAEARNAEATQQKDFESMIQSAKVVKAQKEATLKGKADESARLSYGAETESVLEMFSFVCPISQSPVDIYCVVGNNPRLSLVGDSDLVSAPSSQVCHRGSQERRPEHR